MRQNNRKLRPEEIDAMSDMLDVMGLDSVEDRLPLIEGVEYVRPQTWNEVFRGRDGEDPVPVTR